MRRGPMVLGVVVTFLFGAVAGSLVLGRSQGSVAGLPASTTAGVPGGQSGSAEPTEMTARLAAQEWVALGQELFYSPPSDAARILEPFVAEGPAGDELVKAISAANAASQKRAEGSKSPAWVISTPLASAVRSFDADKGRAKIAVWQVQVLAQGGVVLAVQNWQTSTIDLEWDGGESLWRVWAVSVASGPTPNVLETAEPVVSSAEFEKAMTGMRPVGLEDR